MSDEPVPLRSRRRGLNAGRTAVLWGALVTAATLVISVVEPRVLEGAVVVWAIVVGVIALAYVAAVMLRHIPLREIPRRELTVPRRLRRYRPERQAAPGLREMERMVIFGQASAYDFESRLRPHLVAIADQRLGEHGLTLQSAPERVRALLGDDAWEIVRPDYEPIGDRRRFGVPWPKLVRAVESLEALHAV